MMFLFVALVYLESCSFAASTAAGQAMHASTFDMQSGP